MVTSYPYSGLRLCPCYKGVTKGQKRVESNNLNKCLSGRASKIPIYPFSATQCGHPRGIGRGVREKGSERGIVPVTYMF